MSITLPGGHVASFTLTSRSVPGRIPGGGRAGGAAQRRFAYGSSDYVGVPDGRCCIAALPAWRCGADAEQHPGGGRSGVPVTGYSFVIADAENNIAGGAAESFTWTSDKALNLIAVMNATSTRGCHNALTGLGTTSVTCTGQGTDPGVSRKLAGAASIMTSSSARTRRRPSG